ncbi:SLAIN motif-containing protein-like [Monodelphis domestica]|uniref:SLAIN motif-containing protein-like n=2 Tax=Monodelphis domestica TaxID=13616 RepID=K7E3D5_MONDO|nr:SLAIN motif-containing protein-like [Monodelphis domestica]
MIFPGDDDPIKEPDSQISGERSTENLVMDPDTEAAAFQGDFEVDEVEILLEPTRRLEIQTRKQLDDPEGKRQIGSYSDNQNVGSNIEEIRDFSSEIEKQSSFGEINLEMKESKSLKADKGVQVQVSGIGASSPSLGRNTGISRDSSGRLLAFTGSCSGTVGIEKSTRPKLKTSKMAGQIFSTETKSSSFHSDTALFDPMLDDVEVLELSDLCEDDTNWLYALPKRRPLPVEQKTESLLKWCRQVLDHPSPKAKATSSTFLHKLDKTSRWKTLSRSTLTPSSAHSPFREPLFSSGTQKTPETLESTRKPLFPWGVSGFLQDRSSSSAATPYEISSVSFQSLRGNQELDTVREHEDDYECSQLFPSTSKYTSSLPSLPPCPAASTSGDYGKVVPPPIVLPKRSGPSSRQGHKKWADTKDQLYSSMPREIRPGLHSVGSVRSSLNLEWDVQAPRSRLARIPEAVSLLPSKSQFSSSLGKPLLNIRKPMKAEPSAVLNPRQPMKPSSLAKDPKPEALFSPGPLRRHLSPPSFVSGATTFRGFGVKERKPATETSSPEAKLMEPPSRSLQPTKPSNFSDKP